MDCHTLYKNLINKLDKEGPQSKCQANQLGHAAGLFPPDDRAAGSDGAAHR